MEKDLKARKGMKNRHTDGMPSIITNMMVVVEDADGERIHLCEWKPYNEEAYAGRLKPHEGYLGTAKVVGEPYNGVEFDVWQQNNNQFIWYSVVKDNTIQPKETEKKPYDWTAPESSPEITNINRQLSDLTKKNLYLENELKARNYYYASTKVPTTDFVYRDVKDYLTYMMDKFPDTWKGAQNFSKEDWYAHMEGYAAYYKNKYNDEVIETSKLKWEIKTDKLTSNIENIKREPKSHHSSGFPIILDGEKSYTVELSFYSLSNEEGEKLTKAFHTMAHGLMLQGDIPEIPFEGIPITLSKSKDEPEKTSPILSGTVSFEYSLEEIQEIDKRNKIKEQTEKELWQNMGTITGDQAHEIALWITDNFNPKNNENARISSATKNG